MIFASDLTWIILLPVIGALAAMVTPVRFARWLALIFATATFVLSIAIFFRIAANGYNFGNLNNPAESINLPWINFTASNVTFRINYFLGVDGLSLPLVILNALLTMLAIIGGWEKPRVKEYMALLLLLETGVMGVFLSLDLLLFFLFWEVELAPMFLLIGIWGYDALSNWISDDSSYWRDDEPATAYLPVDLPGFRNKDTYVPVPYMAAGCAYRRANRGECDPGGYIAQDGCVWADPRVPDALASRRTRVRWLASSDRGY